MNYSFSEFKKIYKQYDIVPIKLSLKISNALQIHDLLSLLHKDQFVLLEGVSQQVKHDQFTYLGIDPYLTFQDINGTIYEKYTSHNKDFQHTEPIYDFIKKTLKRYQRIPAKLPVFAGGIMGMLTYESVRYLENINFNNSRKLDMPLSHFMIPHLMIIMDNYSQKIQIIYSIFTEFLTPELLAESYERACNKLNETKRLIESAISAASFEPLPLINPYKTVDYRCNMDSDTFIHHVNRCKQYITEGDIFQVQISRRISLPFSGNPYHLYCHLRHHNPSPLMFYVHLNDTHLIGSSPELLVNVDNGKMCIRPIAGTRKRFSKTRSESEIINELQHDPKEKAEHIMLVDLARHDIGRACQVQSVVVNDLMYIEKYSHVVHMVSDVEGDLLPQYDAVDALKFGFPAGTVTGAPKIRAMEIIEELESDQREFYAGGIAFFDFKGNLKSALTIRTILVKEGISYTQAAGGIVADSIPEMELLETENKMKMCLSAMYQYNQNGATV